MQIALPLHYRSAAGERDFFVSEANRDAVAMLDRWPDWSQPRLLLIGPVGAGKSHLARVFAARSAASVHDDLDQHRDEEALFHAWNAASAGNPLLCVARTDPRTWGIGLPDLASRLAATPIVAILPPDDILLSAVLAKQFRDRGLTVGPDVIGWLTTRIERSFAAAAAVVELLDKAALAQGRAITIPLAKAVLDAQFGMDF